MKRRGYRKPVQDLAGIRTWVDRDSQKGIPADTTRSPNEDYKDPGSSEVRERALPMSEAVPSQREKYIPQPWFNAPIYEKGTGSGHDDVKIKPRTVGVPGEQYGHPSKNDYGYVTRRSMTASAERVARHYLATFFREERPPGQAPQNWLGDDQDQNTGVPRVPPTKDTPEGTSTWVKDEKAREKSAPAHGLDITPVHDNPGSAKVIPSNRDFVNNTDWKKYASVYIREIDDTTSEDIKRRAREYTPKRSSSDAGVLSFKVGKHTVRVRASFEEGQDSYRGAKVDVSCSCPFWKWSGPEHWAQKRGYLHGRPRGTASKPVVRDPEEQHGCCKHVYAVLDNIRDRTPPGRG